MSDSGARSLPRGRHRLTREQVAEDQRLRLVVGMAQAMAEQGYVGTPVAAVIKRAGVSRETFYQLYDDKLACFLDALDFVGAVLVGQLAGSFEGPGAGAPIDRVELAIGRYLETIAAEPAFARLFLVEAHAAGAAALERRATLQGLLVDALAAALGATSPEGRFACQTFVAAVASMVTLPIVQGDPAAVLALREPLVTHVRALAAAGVLS